MILVSEPLGKHTICLCDDDNDIAMALACQHAVVPAATARSMEEAIRENPDQITLIADNGRGEADLTLATERALEVVLERLGAEV